VLAVSSKHCQASTKKVTHDGGFGGKMKRMAEGGRDWNSIVFSLPL